MNFTELYDEIVGWTARPDLDFETRSAIRSTTLALHRREKFARDLQTVALSGLPEAYSQQLEIATNFPNYRQASRVYAPEDSNGYEKRYDPVTATDLYDEDGYKRVDIYFLAGTQLNVKSCTPITAVTVQYYRNPIVTPEGSFSSWIADEYPDAIITQAVATILSLDNESEIRQRAERMAAIHWMEILANELEVEGR